MPEHATRGVLLKAAEALRGGDLDAVEALCARVPQGDPGEARTRYLSGLAAYRRNRPGEALALVGRALALAPGEPDYATALGTVLRAVGEPARAATLYRQALAVAGEDAAVGALLAAALAECGDIDGATAAWAAVVRLDSGDDQAAAAIDKLDMVRSLSEAMLAGGPGAMVRCELGESRFGAPARVCFPPSAVAYVQAYKSNLDARANAYNLRAFAGAFGEAGPILPHYFAEWVYDDYLSLRPHLPPGPSEILDVGCGFGGLALVLALHYGRGPAFHLVEQRSIPGSEFSRPDAGAAALDPLACARQLLLANGVSEGCVRLIASDQPERLDDTDYDLVLSLRAWGYVFPIETYLERVLACLAPGARLILDMHKARGGLAALQKHLPAARLIDDRQDLQRCRYDA